MDLDINFLRSVTTVLGFVSFIGMVVWAYSARNTQRFDEAARQVLEHD